MLEHPDVDDARIIAAVLEGWGFASAALEHRPVGFGSHHWIAIGRDGDRRFVTVDELEPEAGRTSDDEIADLDAAFDAARRLADGGLEFVVAPLRAGDGAMVHRLDEHHSVALLPFVDGTAGDHGTYESDEDRRAVRTLVDRLHEATELVSDVARRDDLAIPDRTALERARGELGASWDAGPYGEPARQLLLEVDTRLGAALARYDALASSVRDMVMVITHGEPHAANVMRTSDGLRLIDWDTARLAPPARDLWMLQPLDDADERADHEALELYELWWDLAEVSLGATWFREEHERDGDTAIEWRNFETHARRL